MTDDDSLAEIIATTRRATRDQVAGIWQNQMDKLRDNMSRDWREQMVRIVEDRFTEFEAALQPHLLEAKRDVVRSFGQHWNDCFLRMRATQDDRVWCDALLDAAGGLSKRCAFFALRGETVSFQGARGFDPVPNINAFSVQSAPALLEVALSGKLADTTRTAQNLSSEVAYAFGESHDVRATLIPVFAQERTMGLLYVENPLETAAVEAIALVAGIILDNRLHIVEAARPSSVVRSLTNRGEEAAGLTAQAAPAFAVPPLPRTDAGAQRAARVSAAKLLLGHYRAIRSGSIDATLRAAIRNSREQFNKSFPDSAHCLEAELTRAFGRSVTV